MTPAPDLPLHSAWLELPDKTTLVLIRDSYIGRVAGNEVVIPDHRISRRHAVVQRQGKRFFLVDLGSTNGTFLNETRVFRPTLLNDADIIGVGGQRFVFCQPVVAEGEEDESLMGTAVVVAKTPCWMLLIAVAESAGPTGNAWADRMRQTAVENGGTMKRLTGPSALVHWRADVTAPVVAKSIIGKLAIPRPPAGARLVLHHAMVRVGAGATSAEENLLGADVTFTHKLETVAAALGVGFLLSDAAVKSLDVALGVKAIGSHTVRDTPGTHALFAWVAE